MKKFLSSLKRSTKRITPDSIKEYPWLSIAIFLAVAWWILTKVGSSATWLGDWVRKLTNPDTVAIQQHNENSFDAGHRSLNTAQLTKVRGDAQSLSIRMGTYKGSSFLNRHYWVINTTPVYEILKDYTNPLMKKALEDAYSILYSDARILKADVTDIYSFALRWVFNDQEADLQKKGFL